MAFESQANFFAVICYVCPGKSTQFALHQFTHKSYICIGEPHRHGSLSCMNIGMSPECFCTWRCGGTCAFQCIHPSRNTSDHLLQNLSCSCNSMNRRYSYTRLPYHKDHTDIHLCRGRYFHHRWSHLCIDKHRSLACLCSRRSGHRYANPDLHIHQCLGNRIHCHGIQAGKNIRRSPQCSHTLHLCCTCVSLLCIHWYLHSGFHCPGNLLYKHTYMNPQYLCS